MGKTLKTATWLLAIVLVSTSLVLCQHSPATIPALSNPLGQSPEGEGDLQKATQSVLITKGLDGQARVSQEDTVIRKSQKAGHVAGLVAAAVTGTMPLILAGTVAGRLVGKLMDHGITSKFVKTVKQQTEPGTSALILLADSDPERRQSVIDRLQLYEPRVLESDLPADLEREIAESNNKNAA
jgi:uncharacterized membrane protein